MDYAYETSRSRFRARRESTWIAGAFIQSDWTPNDALSVNAAARADQHSEFGFYPTARLTAAYLVTPDTTVRGSLGSGFRAPSNYELFARFSPDVAGPGDPDLDPETSLSADVGVSHRFAADRGEVGATLFWLEINDLIEFDAGDFVTGRPAAFFQDDGTAISRGLELSALWSFGPFATLSGAYTYTDAEGADGRSRDRIPRHDVALALGGSLLDRVSYDLNANLVWDLVDRSAGESAGFAKNYVVVNARLAYAVTEQAEVYVRAANLFDGSTRPPAATRPRPGLSPAWSRGSDARRRVPARVLFDRRGPAGWRAARSGRLDEPLHRSAGHVDRRARSAGLGQLGRPRSRLLRPRGGGRSLPGQPRLGRGNLPHRARSRSRGRVRPSGDARRARAPRAGRGDLPARDRLRRHPRQRHPHGRAARTAVPRRRAAHRDGRGARRPAAGRPAAARRAVLRQRLLFGRRHAEPMRSSPQRAFATSPPSAA